MSFYIHGGPLTNYDRRYCFSLVVYMCATAHLTNRVFWDFFGNLAKQVGARWEKSTVLGLQDKSQSQGGTTDRGRLVCSQKTAVFLA